MKVKIRKLLLLCLEFLFPPHCVFCDKIVAPGCKICNECAKEVVPVHAVRCMNPSGSGQNIPCIVLYAYKGKVRNSMIRFKFYGDQGNASVYAQKLSECIHSKMADEPTDLVTAVPISRERRKTRGYNQSELIAREIACCLDLPYQECLDKKEDNPEQHLLSRTGRIENVKGLYEGNQAQIQGKRILLIDDIVTTGSTLCECAGVLTKCGAKSVVCAAVAEAEEISG